MWIKFNIAGIALMALLLTSCSHEGIQPPNIIYILADDLGVGDPGCYGGEVISTPELDRMASEGMRFTQHYAGAPVCAPSRCVLMTGLHTGHARIRGNGGPHLQKDDLTLAEILKNAGYATGIVGKWGLGEVGTSGEPNRQGFDFFYGYDHQVLAHNYYPEYLWRNQEKEYLRNAVKYVDSSHWSGGLGSYSPDGLDYSHDLFVQESIAFINRNRSGPFFLYLPFTIPHDNGEAPLGERYQVPSEEDYEEKDWGSDARGYAAMITRMDRDLGQIRSLLAELEIDQNTLIIFSSDNGAENQFPFFRSNGDLRGGKRDLYEGGIRVPMIATWPGTIEAGSLCEDPSAFWDIPATLADLAGLPLTNTDGISLRPSLLGEEEKQESHDFLYWEFHKDPRNENREAPKIAVRMGPWKGILLDGNTMELYQLENDEQEALNVAEKHPEVVQEMLEIIERNRKDAGIWKVTLPEYESIKLSEK